MVLKKWESDAFLMIVESNTYHELRYQLSYALKQVRFPMATSAIDGFQRSARKMWKPCPSEETGP